MMARAAQMPRIVASMEAETPTIRLFHVASISAGVCGSSWYHLKVTPCSGNFGVAAVLTEKTGSSSTGR